MSEREVEVPWAIQNAVAPILDVGCAESDYLHALEWPVDGIDCRPNHRGPLRDFFLGDIRNFAFSGPYATVLAISTLEHIGLAHEPYGTPADDPEGGDRDALLACVAAAGVEGVVLASVPFGRALDYGWFRQYDEERLKHLCDGLVVNWAIYAGPRWLQCEPAEAGDLEYDLDHASARAVALITIGAELVAPKDYKTIGHIGRIDTGRESQFSKDRDAYQRLRKQGLQPPNIDGCAKLESEAVTRDEIQTGVIKGNLSAQDRKKEAKERRAAFDRARDLAQ